MYLQLSTYRSFYPFHFSPYLLLLTCKYIYLNRYRLFKYIFKVKYTYLASRSFRVFSKQRFLYVVSCIDQLDELDRAARAACIDWLDELDRAAVSRGLLCVALAGLRGCGAWLRSLVTGHGLFLGSELPIWKVHAERGTSFSPSTLGFPGRQTGIFRFKCIFI